MDNSDTKYEDPTQDIQKNNICVHRADKIISVVNYNDSLSNLKCDEMSNLPSVFEP